MTEKEAIEKIHSVYPTGCKNGLENMRALMGRLGNPQEKLTMVHVAGTNGKGSCCAMIERMLRAAGYKTGLYTSPYIEVYNERIRINGEPIAGDKLAALVESVWPAVEACEKDGVQITEFELGTALAFCCFAKEKVNVAVIEVGLGGRLDPTNIITPAVSVITEVGMDHMQLLGDTIEQIALEKAGIMKPGVPVVLGRQEKAARGVLLAAAKGKELPILSLTAENVKEERTRITGRAAGAQEKGLQNSDERRSRGAGGRALAGAAGILRARAARRRAQRPRRSRALRLSRPVDAEGEHRAHQRDDARQGDGKDVPAPRRARALRRLYPAEHPARHARRGAGEGI